MFNLRKDRLEYEFLPEALEIELTPPSPIGRWLIWLVMSILFIAILWSYFGEIDVVAVARGKIIPDGNIKVIQPSEEGVITAIHVNEGQRVKKDQLLIELDTTVTEAVLKSYQDLLAVDRFEKQMLTAELNGVAFKEVSFESGLLENQAVLKILDEQERLKEARESEYEVKKAAMQATIQQKNEEIEIEGIRLTQLERKYALLEFTQGEKATKGNDIVSHLNEMNEIASLKQDIEAQKRNVDQAKSELDEANQNLEALKKERERTILDQLVEIDKNITAVQVELIKAQKQYDSQKIVSPVDGIVQGLASYTIGGTVTSAQPLITIVPLNTPLVVEAMVSNLDIGFVKEGQDVRLKIDTFPFQKFGTVQGEIMAISPDAFDDKNLGPVFKAKVRLNQDNLKVNGKSIPLSPGMTVSAEVKTGKRRIIEFFLSPIMKYAKESLNVR